MGRHFRKNSNIERKLKLLILLLIVAAAAFAAGGFIARAPTGGDVAARQEYAAEETISGDGMIESDPAEADSARLETSSPPPEEGKPETAYIYAPDVPYAVPEGEKPLLAIIIDDGGNQMDLTKRVAGLDLPLTWAILPYAGYTAKTAAMADLKKIPYLLHLPMQAQSDKDGGGAYLIGRGMTKEQIGEVTAKALDIMPGAIGLNNHRGSLATSDVEIMEPVIGELKKRGLIFVDSRTSEKSVAYNVARVNGVHALKNRGFLDGSQEKQQIEKRFNEILKLAAKRGSIVVICHFRPATVTFLETIARKKDSLPVRFVTIPEMTAILNAGTD